MENYSQFSGEMKPFLSLTWRKPKGQKECITSMATHTSQHKAQCAFLKPKGNAKFNFVFMGD